MKAEPIIFKEYYKVYPATGIIEANTKETKNFIEIEIKKGIIKGKHKMNIKSMSICINGKIGKEGSYTKTCSQRELINRTIKKFENLKIKENIFLIDKNRYKKEKGDFFIAEIYTKQMGILMLKEEKYKNKKRDLKK